MPIVPSHIGSGDAVQPRDTVSVIESVSPALPDGVQVTIVGADTYVRLESQGIAVEVPGYENEPYLRIDEDGVVEVNDGSMTTLLNSERYGRVELSTFVATQTPQWRKIATNGIAMWHDHRSHWMSPMRPATLDDKGTVQPFTIPMVIGGVETSITGTLYLRDQASPLWWISGLFAVAAMVVVSLAWRRSFFVALAVVSCVGLLVGTAEYFGLPDGARITPVMMLFSLAALVVAVVALLPRFSTNGGLVGMSLNAGAGATLVVTAWLCVDQVRAAYVPGLDQQWMARMIVPVMFGAGIVAVLDGVARIVFPRQQ
jgi:hypothetical protein